MLRRWQQQCIGLAYAKFLSGGHHFLAQATPGAGKTIMAANLAKKLLDKGMIDFVVCFAPSKAVSRGIESTFSRVLECNFKGQLGDLGVSLTYQSLRTIDKSFWTTLSSFKVLCIFDEIHHCGGDNEDNFNSWGLHTLTVVQEAATYTLALSGTPWRSDKAPVTLATYADSDGHIVCDYQYLLSQAVADGVCRRPKIALVDCEKTVLSDSNSREVFTSIGKLMSSKKVGYSSFLRNPEALSYILGEAINRLRIVRKTNVNAAGLVVAASIKHASQIATILRQKYGEASVVVTHKTTDAQSAIESFKNSACRWIISVGMISEGTDIPRLQVCCYLSNVKTELYFRQVLGRVLRVTKAENQDAWLYTFAEPKLLEFADQVEIDLPSSCVSIKKIGALDDHKESQYLARSPSTAEDRTSALGMRFLPSSGDSSLRSTELEKVDKTYELYLQEFNQRVIEAFRC